MPETLGNPYGLQGRAALELGVRIAHNNRSRLRALLIANEALAISATQPDAVLVELIRDARARLGRLFNTDVLTQRSRQQLFRQSPGRLLIVGKRFADEIGLPLDEVPDGDRCLIVVQGAVRNVSNGVKAAAAAAAEETPPPEI